MPLHTVQAFTERCIELNYPSAASWRPASITIGGNGLVNGCMVNKRLQEVLMPELAVQDPEVSWMAFSPETSRDIHIAAGSVDRGARHQRSGLGPERRIPGPGPRSC
jgi:hypothetical protein